MKIVEAEETTGCCAAIEKKPSGNTADFIETDES